MSQNVFDMMSDVNNQVDVNTYDWSHANNFTGQFGYAYPIFTGLVPAKSSLRIKPDLGLQFMPMAFPVQTRMMARVSAFKVPLRTLWDDYMDYVGNFRENLEEPYIDMATSFSGIIGTAEDPGLGDYMDLPTTLVGNYGTTSMLVNSSGTNARMILPVSENPLSNTLSVGSTFAEYPFGATPIGVSTDIASAFIAFSLNDGPLQFSGTYDFGGFNVDTISVKFYADNEDDENKLAQFLTPALEKKTTPSFSLVCVNGGVITISIPLSMDSSLLTYSSYPASVIPGSPLLPYYITLKVPTGSSITIPQPKNGDKWYMIFGIPFPSSSNWRPVDLLTGLYRSFETASFDAGIDSFIGSFTLSDETDSSNVTWITRSTSPYYDSTNLLDKERQLKISAYSFRAYEAIYNAYYRDNRNNPYYVNGQIEYNKWIPTKTGGSDSTDYQLRRVAWEKDYLTTAVQSPQQGKAPLIGLTTYAETTTTDGVTTTALKLALVDEDGKRYAVNATSNEDGITGISYADLDGATPLSQLSFRTLVDSVSTGISIPDLRIVNAYQKFLELNMRKGYSYKQIVEGRFDCQVRYDELQMPEFIGGFTRPITMNRVVQSVEKEGAENGNYKDQLGSQAGDAFLNTGDVPDFSVYCDEESIVMCIMSVAPIPNYSQLLPKHFLYRDLLDHFQPEFDNLGYQPITYKEVSPVQTYNARGDLNAVFGYQRPWYEYVARTDTVHGLFRTQLRNFLINRVFDVPPTLSESFLLVDPEQVNDVFTVTETTHKIFGQIFFNITAKLPIKKVVIPRLD